MSLELNLIPPHRRRLLDKQSTINNLSGLVRALGRSLIVLTIIGVGAILVLQVLVLAASQSSAGELDIEISRFKDRREEIARQNQRLSIMHDVSAKRVVWSDLVPDLLTIMPNGVSLDQIKGRVLHQNATIDLHGRAVNRNTLLALNERLESLSWVSNVMAPHANLLGRLNPEFSFTLQIKK